MIGIIIGESALNKIKFLEKKLNVKAVRFTKGAQEKIESLGGKVEVI